MERKQIKPENWKRWGAATLMDCPGCETRMRLDHDIDEAGVVSPSVDCPFCDFHDYVQLDGWAAGRDTR